MREAIGVYELGHRRKQINKRLHYKQRVKIRHIADFMQVTVQLIQAWERGAVIPPGVREIEYRKALMKLYGDIGVSTVEVLQKPIIDGSYMMKEDRDTMIYPVKAGYLKVGKFVQEFIKKLPTKVIKTNGHILSSIGAGAGDVLHDVVTGDMIEVTPETNIEEIMRKVELFLIARTKEEASARRAVLLATNIQMREFVEGQDVVLYDINTGNLVVEEFTGTVYQKFFCAIGGVYTADTVGVELLKEWLQRMKIPHN